MPTANTDSISFPGEGGEPVIVSREDFTPDAPLVTDLREVQRRADELAEQNRQELTVPEKVEEKGVDSPSVGNSSSPSTRTNASSKQSSNKRTGSR